MALQNCLLFTTIAELFKILHNSKKSLKIRDVNAGSAASTEAQHWALKTRQIQNPFTHVLRLQEMELGGSMNMRKLLRSLQQEVISGRRRFFSPDRSRDSSPSNNTSSNSGSKEKKPEDDVTVTSSSRSVTWHEPTARTCGVMAEIYTKLFTEENELNLDFIEKTLTLCPPNEDILIVEDRDHYNLMQKAIIFDSVPLVTLLLNHGCEVNGCKSVEMCTVSRNKCSHAGR